MVALGPVAPHSGVGLEAFCLAPGQLADSASLPSGFTGAGLYCCQLAHQGADHAADAHEHRRIARSHLCEARFESVQFRDPTESDLAGQ
ncbi:hypothetical protein DUD43_01655 [Alcaligenes faecalis]|nr:hypothetical protein [Providencia rettgeri]MBX7032642.1 hypothetical protein [Alcaligenes faecalis]QFY76485.1 hypothetical protein DUD43_01655 [Alcaligenes faecalis]